MLQVAVQLCSFKTQPLIFLGDFLQKTLFSSEDVFKAAQVHKTSSKHLQTFEHSFWIAVDVETFTRHRAHASTYVCMKKCTSTGLTSIL